MKEIYNMSVLGKLIFTYMYLVHNILNKLYMLPSIVLYIYVLYQVH